MHLRVHWKVQGGHVHCRMFSGSRKDTTHGKNGDLVFTVQEWEGGVWDALAGIADVSPEHDIPAHWAVYGTELDAAGKESDNERREDGHATTKAQGGAGRQADARDEC